MSKQEYGECVHFVEVKLLKLLSETLLTFISMSRNGVDNIYQKASVLTLLSVLFFSVSHRNVFLRVQKRHR